MQTRSILVFEESTRLEERLVLRYLLRAITSAARGDLLIASMMHRAALIHANISAYDAIKGLEFSRSLLAALR